MIEVRERKSKFVKLFDKTPESIFCPHFYELILSNGCPFDCSYCYLKLTFRGKTNPVLFNNDWPRVEAELEAMDHGVFSTGELADSLAVIPPLLEKALGYFGNQKGKYLLLLTKSTNIDILRNRTPSQQIIASFSISSMPAAKKYEKGAPDPMKRLEAARELKDLGWRIRIRIDPIILESGLEHYEPICKAVSELSPEVVTIGTLRQYPGVHRFSKEAPREGLKKAPDGRMRYLTQQRIDTYKQISEWLGIQPALCKEAVKMWEALGWIFRECNCTNGFRPNHTSLFPRIDGGVKMVNDSTLEKWEYREHTKVKHILLEKYLRAWIPILGKRNPRICYFDGFSGRGEYTDGALGSPIIALKIADELAQYYGKMLFVFVEKNDNNFRNLEKILEREEPTIRNLYNMDIRIENEEFANVIFDYLEEDRSVNIPSFFFIDPFGFSGVPFDTIKRILSNPKTEIFFTFML